MSGIMMAERLWRERKERIRKEKTAAALSPLAWRVAARFMDECDTELGGKSDSELLEMVQAFGANKALDISAKEIRKDILEFVNSIDHEKRANQIAVKISDLMGRENFANQVVFLVKENQYLHIE